MPNTIYDRVSNILHTSDLTFTWDDNGTTINGVPVTHTDFNNCLTSLPTVTIKESIYIPMYKQVIFNNPATIIIWEDGTKTVVKCSSKDEFDPYYGLCCAITKKMIGNNSKIKKILKEATYCKENKYE